MTNDIKKIRQSLLTFEFSPDHAEILAERILHRPPLHPGTPLGPWPGNLAKQLGDLVFVDPQTDKRFLITDSLEERGSETGYRAFLVNPPFTWVCIKLPNIRVIPLKDLPKVRQDFQREAAALQGLRHPSLVRLETFGETSDGDPYLVLEYVKGRPLSDTPLQSWDVKQRFLLFQQIVNGLAYLHSLGRTHGDLSPRHVLLDSQNQIKITGFDMANLDMSVSRSVNRPTVWATASLNTSPEQEPLSYIVGLRGILGYLAPEYVHGEPYTRPSDIFSLGCLLHYLMTETNYTWAGSTIPGSAFIPNVTRDPHEPDPVVSWGDTSLAQFLASLFRQMVRYRPQERPSIHQIQEQLEQQERSSSISSTAWLISPAALAKTTPAYFLSLTLENLRCFGPAQTLDLSDGKGNPARWTVILGDNGTGKTTLLRWLVAMEPVVVERPSSSLSLYADTVIEPKIASSRWPEAIRMWAFHAHSQATAGWSKVVLSPRKTLTAPSTPDPIEFTVGHSQRNGLALQAPNVSSYPLKSHQPPPYLVCHGYGAHRQMAAQRLVGDAFPDPSASLFSDDVGLENPEEWLLQADYAASKASHHTEEHLHSQRKQIQHTLIDLLPDVEDLRLVGLDESPPTPRVEFKTPYGWVRLHDLSLGYRTLITWMVDLAHRLYARYPESPNPLAEPAVVLIDEIDLHTHPRWQQSIMHHLSQRFPNTQFIVTAHSPLIVQAFPDANLVVLQREGNHVSINNHPQTVHGWRVDQILTSDLFGLESTRPPDTQKILDERQRILSQPELKPSDHQRLRELNRTLETLPTAETAKDIEAMDIIRRAAKILQDKGLARDPNP